MSGKNLLGIINLSLIIFLLNSITVASMDTCFYRKFVRNSFIDNYTKIYFCSPDFNRVDFYNANDSNIGFIYIDSSKIYTGYSTKGLLTKYSIDSPNKNEIYVSTLCEINPKKYSIIKRIYYPDKTNYISEINFIQSNEPDNFFYADSTGNIITNISIVDCQYYKLILEEKENYLIQVYDFGDIQIVMTRRKGFFSWLFQSWENKYIYVFDGIKIKYVFWEPYVSWDISLPSYRFNYKGDMINRIDYLFFKIDYQEFAENLLEDMLDNKPFDIDSLVAANSKYEPSINFRRIDDTLYCDNPEELWLYHKVVFSRDSMKPEELPYLK